MGNLGRVTVSPAAPLFLLGPALCCCLFLVPKGMRNLNQDAKPRFAASLSTFQEPAIRALNSGHAVFHPAQPLGQTALTTDQWSSDRIPQQGLLDFTIQPRLAENGIPGLTLQHYFQEMPRQ